MTDQPLNTPAAPPAPAPGANAFFIKFKVKPGKTADFERAMGDLMNQVREKEPRNVHCDLLHLAQDPQTYTILERFRDAEAVKLHAESAHIKKLGESFRNDDLLEGPPEVQELVFIRSK